MTNRIMNNGRDLIINSRIITLLRTRSLFTLKSSSETFSSSSSSSSYFGATVTDFRAGVPPAPPRPGRPRPRFDAEAEGLGVGFFAAGFFFAAP